MKSVMSFAIPTPCRFTAAGLIVLAPLVPKNSRFAARWIRLLTLA
jgi:hypothetical protein